MKDFLDLGAWHGMLLTWSLSCVIIYRHADSYKAHLFVLLLDILWRSILILIWHMNCVCHHGKKQLLAFGEEMTQFCEYKLLEAKLEFVLAS